MKRAGKSEVSDMIFGKNSTNLTDGRRPRDGKNTDYGTEMKKEMKAQ
jgi:hypothetical protein